MQRHIIRVELPPVHAGVTAALRRAFADATPKRADSPFDALLRRMN